ncbi:unnamed protein product [Parascedosporium putredinis]|uniref:F-box domain-containing protein n=1 Tax=Parascedosporium putredinis TaxID=1442378 RepID=A0A9P1H7T9_9PEZI|nr:unnamed protein product [Parascedosporium putredinis]CAI8000038.1 unnamed protein product [Parascedosporium putredinis]
MPTEILDITLDFLPAESVVSFALTCRGLHAKYSVRNQILDSAARESLLLLLEKDAAALYYCYHCSSLHKWHPTSTTSRASTAYKLKFHTARLALHGRIRGPAHGPELEKLHMDHAVTLGSRNITIKESWAAKVIDGELFLRAVWNYHQGAGGAKTLGRWVEHDADRFICNHVKGSRLLEFPGAEGLDLSSVERLAGPVRSCPICYTDFQMEVRGDEWDESESESEDDEEAQRGSGGWSINVTKWVRLGACESPLDAHWQTLASQSAHGLECEPRNSSCEAGEIRHRWVDGKQKPSAYQGRFVEAGCLQVPHY